MDGGSPRQPSEGLRAAREELRAVMAAALRRQDTKGRLVMGVNHELLIRSDLTPAWDAGLPLSLPGPSASSLWINPSFGWTEAEPDGCLRWYWLPLKSDWTPQVPNLKFNLLTVIVWLMTDWSDFVAKGDFCTYFHNQSLKFSKVAGKHCSTATDHLILLCQLDVAVARMAVFKNQPGDSEWKRRESARLLAFKQQKLPHKVSCKWILLQDAYYAKHIETDFKCKGSANT